MSIVALFCEIHDFFFIIQDHLVLRKYWFFSRFGAVTNRSYRGWLPENVPKNGKLKSPSLTPIFFEDRL